MVLTLDCANKQIFGSFVGTFGLPFERRIDMAEDGKRTVEGGPNNDKKTALILSNLQDLKLAGCCKYERWPWQLEGIGLRSDLSQQPRATLLPSTHVASYGVIFFLGGGDHRSRPRRY